MAKACSQSFESSHCTAPCLQVGRTQRWEVTGAASGVGSVNATIYDVQRYLEDSMSPSQNPGMIGAKPGDNIFGKSNSHWKHVCTVCGCARGEPQAS